jgi:hypothetical protein
MGGPATTRCLEDRRPALGDLVRPSSGAVLASPGVTVKSPGLPSDGYRLALGFWPEGVQGLQRSRVAVGHFRRKREAPLTVEGHPGHWAGHPRI